MYGGVLNPDCIHYLKHYLIAAFGCEFYVFSPINQVCLSRIGVGHQSKIICAWVQQQQSGYVINSVDEYGLCIRVEVSLQSADQASGGTLDYKVISKKQISNKKQKINIISASFVTSDLIVLIDKNRKLWQFSLANDSLASLFYDQNYSKLFNNSTSHYLFALEASEKNLRVCSKLDLNATKDYVHHCKISSVTNVNDSLVIGDERGKITLHYDLLAEKKTKKQQKVQSVLQWHTGPVLSLCSNSQYIYSAGQESVVVLWHTGDLSRDFLPRVRTAINSVSVKQETNQVICGMSDNTIKVIDLSRDKQTRTFRTIVDPKGYAPSSGGRFSATTTDFNNGMLCLNGLPGKLQFINLLRNGQNTELQVVPRNLINSINEDKMQPHRITSFAFSQDRSVLMASLQSTNTPSYLKFYRKGMQGYELTSKIEHPHQGLVSACMAVSNGKSSKFISYSLQDKSIKIWGEHRQKKKSIIDVDEVYWKCEGEIKYRSMLPSFVGVHYNLITAVYSQSVIVVYHLQQGGNIIVRHQIQEEAWKNIKEVYVLGSSPMKSGTDLKLLVLRNSLQIQVWAGQKSNKQLQLTNIYKVNIKNTNSHFVCKQGMEIAVIINSQKSSQLLIFDSNKNKFTEAYDSDSFIQSAFWMGKRLIVIGSDLVITSLDGKQFIKYEQNIPREANQIEEEQTDIRANGVTDIFKLNERWVERESLKSKRKVEDSIEGLQLLPNCVYAWEEVASKIII